MDYNSAAVPMTPDGGEAMSDNELAALLSEQERLAVGYYNSDIADQQASALDYYYGEPFGNEVDGHSQVVSQDVAEVVDWAMPALMRIFCGSDEVMAFEPTSEEDVEAAEQATDYVSFVIKRDNPGFTIFHDWFKDALLQKLGVVKVYWEQSDVEREHSLENLTAEDLAVLGDVEFTEVVEYPGEGAPLYAVKFKRADTEGKVCIVNVPPEEFRISALARSVDDAPYTAHKPMRMTRSDLVGLGFDADVVWSLPSINSGTDDDPRTVARYRDEDYGNGERAADKSQELLDVIEEYVRIDYDGDGVSELRQVWRSNTTILSNTVVDFNPWAAICPVPMSHKVYGQSLADKVMDLQLVNSTIWRQTLDNLYQSNNPRIEVPESAERSDGSTLEDLMNNVVGSVIRTRQGGMLSPVVVPFMADKSFQMLGYVDQQKESRTGVSRLNQGADPNVLGALNSGKAVDLLQTAGNQRQELIARIFAETGVSQLYRKVYKLLVRHQPRERVVRLRNKWVPIDPRSWNDTMDVCVTGIGVGSQQQQVANMMQVLTVQRELVQVGVAGPKEIYNASKRLLAALGIKDANNFLINPEDNPQQQSQPSPEEMKAQAEQMAAQSKMQLEQAKAQADIEVAREKNAASIEMEREKAAMQAELAREKAAAEMALAQAKMEMESNLAQQRMAMEAELSRERMAQDGSISASRPGGSLSE